MRGLLLLLLFPSVAFAQSESNELVNLLSRDSNEVRIVAEEVARVGVALDEQSRQIDAVKGELDSTVAKVYEIFARMLERFEEFGKESDARAAELNALRGDLLETNEKMSALRELLTDQQVKRVELPSEEQDKAFSNTLRLIRDRSLTTVLIKPKQGLDIEFPAKIVRGYRSPNSQLIFERYEEHLVIFLKDEMDPEGEVILVGLEGGRIIAVRIQQVREEQAPDVQVRIAAD